MDVINGVSHYHLPVVYISKTFFGEYPVNVKWIASRLKGVAHVLVQKDEWLNTRLRRECSDKNEYYGAVGIYYPNQAVGHKRFLYRAYEGSDDILMERVIRSVIQYTLSWWIHFTLGLELTMLYYATDTAARKKNGLLQSWRKQRRLMTRMN